MKNEEINEVSKILATAKALEREAYHTYLEFALKTSALSGKDLFIRLAKDEANHFDVIEEMITDLQVSDDVAKRKPPEALVKALAPGSRDVSFTENNKAISDDANILKLAMDHENRSMNYYREKAEKITLPQAKELLLALAEIEDGHYKILEAELNSVQENGYWFDFREFSMELE